MLVPKIISYKLTINMSVTYYVIQQYPVNTIYNIKICNIFNAKVVNQFVCLKFVYCGLRIIHLNYI